MVSSAVVSCPYCLPINSSPSLLPSECLSLCHPPTQFGTTGHLPLAPFSPCLCPTPYVRPSPASLPAETGPPLSSPVSPLSLCFCRCLPLIPKSCLLSRSWQLAFFGLCNLSPVHLSLQVLPMHSPLQSLSISMESPNALMKRDEGVCPRCPSIFHPENPTDQEDREAPACTWGL